MKLLHVLLAVVLQFGIAIPLLFLGVGMSLYFGATASSFYFLGREMGQAEYRWIERHGGGLRANMPRFAIITDSRDVWSEKSVLWDTALPAAVTFGLAYLLNGYDSSKYWLQLVDFFRAL